MRSYTTLLVAYRYDRISRDSEGFVLNCVDIARAHSGPKSPEAKSKRSTVLGMTEIGVAKSRSGICECERSNSDRRESD